MIRSFNYCRQYTSFGARLVQQFICGNHSFCGLSNTSTTRWLQIALYSNNNILDTRYNTLLQCNVIPSQVTKRNKSKKAKGKKKGGGSKIDLSVGDDIVDLKKLSEDMVSTSQHLQETYRTKFAMKLTLSTLDNIRLSVKEGGRVPLYEVAEVTSVGQQFHVKCVSDATDVESISRAITSSLNITPTIDGDKVTMPMTAASLDYKEAMRKGVKDSTEKSIITIRNIRQKAMTATKKHSSMASDDIIKMIEKQIQLISDEHSKQIKSLLADKLAELE